MLSVHLGQHREEGLCSVHIWGSTGRRDCVQCTSGASTGLCLVLVFPSLFPPLPLYLRLETRLAWCQDLRNLY